MRFASRDAIAVAMMWTGHGADVVTLSLRAPSAQQRTAIYPNNYNLGERLSVEENLCLKNKSSFTGSPVSRQNSL